MRLVYVHHAFIGSSRPDAFATRPEQRGVWQKSFIPREQMALPEQISDVTGLGDVSDELREISPAIQPGDPAERRLARHNGVVQSRVEPLRVVIVDDNPEFLDSARRLLEHQGVRVVGLASTSADGLRYVQELRADVTLVDVNLGEESGFDLAETFQESGDWAPVPVILISTHAEPDLADMIETSPAIGFLAKSALSAGAITAAIDRLDYSRVR